MPVCHSTLKHWLALLVWTNIKYILKRNNSWLNALHACSFWNQKAPPPVFICSWTLNALPVHMPLVTAWHLWSRSWAESGAGRGFKMTFRKQYRYQNSLQPGKAGQTWRDKYQVRKQKTKVLSYGSLIAHVQPASLLLSWISSLTIFFGIQILTLLLFLKEERVSFHLIHNHFQMKKFPLGMRATPGPFQAQEMSPCHPVLLITSWLSSHTQTSRFKTPSTVGISSQHSSRDLTQ